MDNLLSLFQQYASYGEIFSYSMVFIGLLISGIGVPIPEDISLVVGGILAGQGFANIYYMIFVGMAGVLIGDSIMYALGYIYGVKILRIKFIRRMLTANRVSSIREKFKSNSILFLFVARFLPGLRAGVYLFAGITRKVSYLKFIFIDFCASIISVPVWIVLGYLFGNNLDYLKHLMHKIGLSISIVAILTFVVAIILIKRKVTKKTILANANSEENIDDTISIIENEVQQSVKQKTYKQGKSKTTTQGIKLPKLIKKSSPSFNQQDAKKE